MATVTAARAAAGFPIGGHGEASSLKMEWGSYTFAVNPTIADVVRLCWVPKDARVLGGFVQAALLDTATADPSPALNIDIGWLANGVDAADPVGLGDLGVWHGTAKANLRPEDGNYYVFGGVLFTAGPKKFSAPTRIAATVNAAAETGGTGIMTVVVFYTLDY